MASLRTLNVRGMRVEIWETSFRIEGMSQVIQVGPNLSDERVKQIIQAIYDHVRDAADRSGRERVRNSLVRTITALVDGEKHRG